MLPRLKPRKLYDLVIQVAIVRPGPIQGDMVHPYLRRRNGLEEPDYSKPGPQYPQNELREVLKKTLGVPLFQEQAMKVAMVAAEFSDKEPNGLRKAMGTFRGDGTLHTYEDRMVGRMFEQFRREVMAARLMEVEGVVAKSPENVVHLVARKVTDRSSELTRLSEDHDTTVQLARADVVANPQPPRHAPHRHPRDVRILPGSRDFH